MAYRNTAFGLISLVTLTFACSEQEYKGTPQLAASQNAAQEVKNSDVSDHGAVNEDGTIEPAVQNQSASVPAASKAPAATPAAPAPAASSPEDAIKAMLAKGQLISTYTVEPGKSLAWGTSLDNRIPVMVAVDAAGAVIVPAGITDRQIPAGTPGAPEDTKFVSGGAPAATLASSMRICNNSGEAIYLHSGNGSLFDHGDGPIANATCVQFLARRAVAGDGATYDHADGNNVVNYVYLKVTKIGPDGKVVP